MKALRKTYEHDGDRVRFLAGNLHAWDEREQGGRRGPELLICLSTDHVGEFDKRVYGDRWRHDSQWFLSHHASFVIWHWGVSLTIRGRAIDGPAWDSRGREGDESA